ncbi:MAG: hypothetical protein BWX84_00900 [Verrucomicrobia bacterium ADurb.Bin118]|nr:MAG: hypothetical protein BWX84_00900 [Verrucomicrobia bacterium ADurb.Bin118]
MLRRLLTTVGGWTIITANLVCLGALNGIAWILATSGDAKVRNGSEAVLFAEQLVEATHRKAPACLDTLATAYVEAGQFEKTISTEKEAIALAKEGAEKNGYSSRLTLYEAKKPYREQPRIE